MGQVDAQIWVVKNERLLAVICFHLVVVCNFDTFVSSIHPAIQDEEEDDDAAAEAAVDREVRARMDVDAGEDAQADGVNVQEIDAYWLQRQIAKAFGSIEPEKAQAMAEEVRCFFMHVLFCSCLTIKCCHVNCLVQRHSMTRFGLCMTRCGSFYLLYLLLTNRIPSGVDRAGAV